MSNVFNALSNLFNKEKSEKEFSNTTTLRQLMDELKPDDEKVLSNVLTKRKNPTEKQKQAAVKRTAANTNKEVRNSIQNFVEQQAKPEEHYKEDNNRTGSLYRLRSALGNLNANLAATTPEVLGTLGALFTYPIAKIHSKITGYDGDVFMPMLEENPFIKIGETTERVIRDIYDINQYENMDRKDQLINIASMMVGPGASKSDKILTAALKPGLQITKDASKLVKSTQIGTQIGIPVALNELNRANYEQPGIFYDYNKLHDQETQPETIVLSDRSNASGDKVYNIDVDTTKEVDKEPWYKSNIAKVLGTTAGIIGGLGVARHMKPIKNAVNAYKNKLVDRQNAITFSKTVSPGEKVLHSIDTNTITDKALERNLINDKTANVLYRNTRQQADNAYNTGVLYVNDKIIDTPTPRWLQQSVQNFKKLRPAYGELFDKTMNDIRLLQAGMNRYNLTNNTNFGLTDFLSDNTLKNIKVVSDVEKTYAQAYENIMHNYNMLQRVPEFNSLVNKMSEVQNGLIDLLQETGRYTEKAAEQIRKNRGIFGLNLYLPGTEAVPDMNFLQKIKYNVGKLVDPSNTGYNSEGVSSISSRMESKTLQNAAPWDMTFENEYTRTVKEALDLQQKKMLVDNLTETANDNIKSIVDDINKIEKSTDSLENIKLIKKRKDLTDKISQHFDNIKFLGYKETNASGGLTVPNKNPIYSILNKSEEVVSEAEKALDAKFSIEAPQVDAADRLGKTSAKIIQIPVDNKVLLYEVDPWLGQIVQKDPFNGSLIANSFRKMTDTAKQFITGKYNPTFGMTTAAYTATDQLTGLKSIMKNFDADFSNKNLLKSNTKGFGEALSYRHKINKLNQLYKDVGNGVKKLSSETRDTMNTLENEIKNSRISQIRATGANLQGKYPIGTYKNNQDIPQITVTNKKSINSLLDFIKKSKYANNAITNSPMNIIRYTDYALSSLRDAPTLGLYDKLSSAFMKDGKIDPNAIMNLSRNIDKFTASANFKPANNILGGVYSSFSSVSTYFSDMLAENIARGRMIGIDKLTNDIVNILDKDQNFVKALKTFGKDLTTNDFVKASIEYTAPVVALAAIWNHATPENEAAYDALPDSYKNKGIVFANGVNGVSVVLPLTQSLMWATNAFRAGIADPFFRQNTNDYNYGEDFASAMKDAADVNWRIAMPMPIAIYHNLINERSPDFTDVLLNPVTEELDEPSTRELRPLHKADKTYYHGGVFTPKQRAMAQTLFGNVGTAVTEGIDVAKTRGSFSDGLEAAASKYLTSATNLFNPKASTWSPTSNKLYKRKEALEHANLIQKDFTPEQQNVYHVITMFNNMYLKPIDDKIKIYNDDIKDIKSTGIVNEERQSYYKQQVSINDLTKQIKLLQSHKLKQYALLDKILQQNYNITYDEFMESIK